MMRVNRRVLCVLVFSAALVSISPIAADTTNTGAAATKAIGKSRSSKSRN